MGGLFVRQSLQLRQDQVYARRSLKATVFGRRKHFAFAR
jgi:hypothetical protein